MGWVSELTPSLSVGFGREDWRSTEDGLGLCERRLSTIFDIAVCGGRNKIRLMPGSRTSERFFGR
ncbi:MAG: hypothetical protein A3C61_03045 [Candidatus Yanofskybacteria bacterium RIFCSPHIGHO2_02_FULL_39_10]|uniref:Uncharacterized protein n=1 Tax=Candidatus Yanofskybacteria bacterium RIFCSPHIGHO2_02_FULL_39_10 TaxID=1802674 RepID=A0A1F8F414_9BACT|nr:MAG: hypothetical protein A3C61_03045 [Candidatus Yanofskybacteria bacterium RIFCSPHIGHO2_02_FULL_39_10]